MMSSSYLQREKENFFAHSATHLIIKLYSSFNNNSCDYIISFIQGGGQRYIFIHIDKDVKKTFLYIYDKVAWHSFLHMGIQLLGSRSLGMGLITQKSWPPLRSPLQRNNARITRCHCPSPPFKSKHSLISPLNMRNFIPFA